MGINGFGLIIGSFESLAHKTQCEVCYLVGMLTCTDILYCLAGPLISGVYLWTFFLHSHKFIVTL